MHISLDKFEFEAAEQIQKSMQMFEKSDRFGSLVEITYSKVEKFAEGEVLGTSAKTLPW